MEEAGKVHGLLEIVPVDLRLNMLEEQEKGKFIHCEDLKKEVLYRFETQLESRAARR